MAPVAQVLLVSQWCPLLASLARMECLSAGRECLTGVRAAALGASTFSATESGPVSGPESGPESEPESEPVSEPVRG